jgi:hypothetical protein
MAQMGAITDVEVPRGVACRQAAKALEVFRPRKAAIMTYGHGERKTKGPAGELDLAGHFRGAIQESYAVRNIKEI